MHKQTHKRAFYTLAGCIAALALCVAASLFLLTPAPKAQDVTIPGTRGDIYATVQLPGKLARGEELPLVVLCHGFTGSRGGDGHFAPLAAAYGLPKDTPEQAAHKAAVLETALDAACAVPLEIMGKCAEGIALVEEYAAKGSALAVSDAGCAAVLCKAALQAASLNVFINTKLMTDKTHAAALDAQADALLIEYVPKADAVFAQVTKQLRI